MLNEESNLATSLNLTRLKPVSTCRVCCMYDCTSES